MAEVSTPPTNPRAILLKGDFAKWALEGKVATAKEIIPGMLVEKTTAGENPYGDYQPHVTQGGYSEKIVAMKGMVADIPFSTATLKTGGVDDVFAAGEHVFLHRAQPGEEFWMFLKASGSAVVIGDFLQSAGNGDLEKATSTNQRLFAVLEAKTPGGSRTRCRVRAL
jgi:hypothetical protein